MAALMDNAAINNLVQSAFQLADIGFNIIGNQHLSGLDENSIANLIEEANNAGRYPGLKIGDITTPNDNAGNWE